MQTIIDTSEIQGQTSADASLNHLLTGLSPERQGESLSLLLNEIRRPARFGKLSTDLVYLTISKRFKEETGQDLTQKRYKAGLQELLLSTEPATIEVEEPPAKRTGAELNLRLLRTLSGDPQELDRRKLLKRQFLWTPEGLYHAVSPNIGESRLTQLWLADFSFHGISNLWEPSEEVGGQLQMVDRTYDVSVSTSPEVAERLQISRVDAAGDHVNWPDRLSKVAIPNPEKKNLKRIAQFLDEAATTLSPKETNLYTSTGLIKDGNVHKFATFRGGVLTPTGRETNGQVQLPPDYQPQQRHMERYQFLVDREADVRADFRVLLQCQKLTPGQPGICRVLAAMQGLAPVSQLFTPVCALLYGRSQSKKSTLARLFLQWCTDLSGHQDEWATYNLRAGSSTAYFLEQCSYYLAGLLQVCDDALQADASIKEQEAFFTRWSKLVSYTLTKSGSGRGKSNRGQGGIARNWYPRGPLLGTIEVLPSPHRHASTLGRCILLPLDGMDAVDKTLLTRLQTPESAHSMNRAYTGYVQWLLSHTDLAEQRLQELAPLWETFRLADRLGGVFARAETGIQLLYQYAREIGALTQTEYIQECEQAREELLALARTQADSLHIEAGAAQLLDPVEQFKRAFEEALHRQKICAVDLALRPARPGQVLDGVVVTTGILVYQPPQSLPEDFDRQRLGWKYHLTAQEYDRSAALIAGPLYPHTRGPKLFDWTLRIRSTEWERIYREIEMISQSKEIGFILPGEKEMLAHLEKAGLLAKNRPSDGKKCHLLDLTWLIAPNEESDQIKQMIDPSRKEDEQPDAGLNEQEQVQTLLQRVRAVGGDIWLEEEQGKVWATYRLPEEAKATFEASIHQFAPALIAALQDKAARLLRTIEDVTGSITTLSQEVIERVATQLYDSDLDLRRDFLKKLTRARPEIERLLIHRGVTWISASEVRL